MSDDYIIGIVGGMGPKSGVALFDSIIRNTKCTTDQEHLSVVLMSFPKYIVDRTLFLEGSEIANPAYAVVRIIQKLEQAGASIVGMACNTIYAPKIYDVIGEQLQRINSRVRLLHMPMETCRYIRSHHPSVVRVGVMTTNGTYTAGIYSNILMNWGYEIILPEYDFQNQIIHAMIYDPKYGIKANSIDISRETRLLLKKALSFFKKSGAEAIILGCTELSLLLKEGMVNGMQIIDSTEAMARALIAEATNKNVVYG